MFHVRGILKFKQPSFFKGITKHVHLCKFYLKRERETAFDRDSTDIVDNFTFQNNI